MLNQFLMTQVLAIFFHKQDSSEYTRIKLLLNQTLKDQFIQRWTSEMINSSRGQFYSNFKTDFSFENYLTRLSVIYVMKKLGMNFITYLFVISHIY